jgi:hypothetical protein
MDEPKEINASAGDCCCILKMRILMEEAGQGVGVL